MKRLENPNPRTNWKTGDTAYYMSVYAYDNTVHSGRVEVLGENGATMRDCAGGGFVTLPFGNLFDTMQSASDTLADRHRNAVDAYKSEIPDVAALVRFSYCHEVCPCEEYTNWAAREAYRERTRELLGLDLSD